MCRQGRNESSAAGGGVGSGFFVPQSSFKIFERGMAKCLIDTAEEMSVSSVITLDDCITKVVESFCYEKY